jgi:hypothetical protein
MGDKTLILKHAGLTQVVKLSGLDDVGGKTAQEPCTSAQPPEEAGKSRPEKEGKPLDNTRKFNSTTYCQGRTLGLSNILQP